MAVEAVGLRTSLAAAPGLGRGLWGRALAGGQKAIRRLKDKAGRDLLHFPRNGDGRPELIIREAPLSSLPNMVLQARLAVSRHGGPDRHQFSMI